MKIFLAQQNYHIGNISSNTQKILEAIDQAVSSNADLIVFSELAVCGYPPRDFLYFDGFINQCEKAIATIASHAPNIGVLVGAPQRNADKFGKNLFNAAYFLFDGKVQHVVHKSNLPTYDIFDEDRYFEPANSWEVIQFKGKRLAVTVCEDIWNLGDDPLYKDCPMDKLMLQSPDVMINLSASPFDYTHEEDRKAMIKENVLRYKIPMFYCNAIGSQTEIVFDGTSLVFDASANLCGSLKRFEEDYQIFECLDDGKIAGDILESVDQIASQELAPESFIADLNIHTVHQALILGIRDYFSKMGFQKAIIGSSGGVDSAVVLALTCEALGSENVIAVLMPSEFSSDHSVDDAVKLSNNLNNMYHILPIKNIYDTFLNTLDPIFNGLPFNVAEENIQSRSRGNLLMAIANKLNLILLNTSNKSELATGYGTLYGDMAGGLSILGDCYKTQVYALARYINREREIIPINILEKAPSAELRPNQKDSDSLPDYNILDGILYQYIELQKSPDEIISIGYDASLVKRTLSMVNNNEYKRNQFCPVIRVSPKAFGVGRRMPIVGKYLS